MGKRIPFEIRFERHIERTDTCWIWRGSANQAGYGQFRSGRARGLPVISVHRWAYEHFVGPIPEGLWILHHCDNPRCCRPDHLYAGTATQNAKDRSERHPNARGYKRPFIARKSKITDDMVRAIRLDDRPQNVIAWQHRISETAVSAIKRRTRKAHVQD